MKKKIKKDKEEPYKISATIYTEEELEELDHKIGNELDEIVHQVTDAVLTKREHIVLQKVIEKQKAKLEDLEKNHISKDKIIEKIEEITSYAYTSAEERDCQDYAIQVLKELLGE